MTYITPLVDLIAGRTPTLTDWTTDPTDAANITDGDISTFCTTGTKVGDGAWWYAHFEWDLGGFYDVICSFMGCAQATAGTPYADFEFWDGGAWCPAASTLVGGGAVKHGNPVAGRCSKVRICIASNAAATIIPNIREFHVWRLR